MTTNLSVRKAVAATMLGLGVFSAAGCSFSASTGTKSVSKSDLESQVNTSLSEKAGQQAQAVKCKDGLEAKADATQECAIEFDGEWRAVTVTATSVDSDDNVAFDMQMGTETIAEPDY